MMDKNFNNKDFFIKYGMFVGVLVVVAGILIYPCFVSKKSWDKNLKTTIDRVLDEKNPNQWTIDKQVPISGPMGLNAVAYEVKNTREGTTSTAVLLRVMTFYGPQSALFLCNDEQEVSFVDFSSLHGRIRNQKNESSLDKRIEYWQKKIPEILKLEKK